MKKKEYNRKKLYNYKDNFEMVYLRYEYIKKAKQLDGTLIAKYAGIVHTTAKIMFDRLTNFEKVGFTIDDVVAITNVYMLSYMALYSIQTNTSAMDAILDKRGLSSLSESEIVRIDRNRMINFLRQRLHHCGTLCARKARNITVGIDKRGIFAETLESESVTKDMVLENYKKHGYRKATKKEYKAAMIKAKKEGKSEITDDFGFKIFKVERLNNGISEEDYRVITEANKGIFYQSPDVAFQMIEDEVTLESYKQKYNSMTKEEKNKTLTSFINRNKGDKTLKKELKLARKFLASVEVVV